MDCPALVNVGNEGSVIISAELEDAILALSKQLSLSVTGQIGRENKGTDAISPELILDAFFSTLICVNCNEYSGSYVRDYALILNPGICRHVFAVDTVFRALGVEGIFHFRAVEAFVEIESAIRRPLSRFPTRSLL
jgi:hypothetical protein